MIWWWWVFSIVLLPFLIDKNPIIAEADHTLPFECGKAVKPIIAHTPKHPNIVHVHVQSQVFFFSSLLLLT